MPSEPRTLVVVTTYNEIENLPRLIEEIFAHAPAVDVLVVDDNSPDGTAEWCARRATAEPRLHLLRRAGKQGQGSAIVAGMQYAIEHAYDYVLSMDADFSHHPRYIPDLIGGMDRAGKPPVDVMIGSRYVPGGRIEGWPVRRHMMSRAVNAYARLLLRLSVRDCSGGFRSFRVARLAALDFAGLLSRGYSFHEEILWRLKLLGCLIAETPITFVDRTHGTSKINTREALTAVRVIFLLGMRERFRRT